MKLLSKEHVYKNDWETVTAAWWVKYPNADQPHVVAFNTVQRSIDSEAKSFNVQRIFELDWRLPWVAAKVFGSKSLQGFAVEDITCSYAEKRLEIQGRNHSLSKFLSFEEVCTYERHPENPQWTLFRQSSKFRITGVGEWLSRCIEKVQSSSSSAGIGVMERVIKKLEDTDWKAKAYLWDAELKALVSRHAAKLQERAVLCDETRDRK
jgi:hypothetical protein